MHANEVVLQRLFSSLNKRDDKAMAECYHPKAKFEDIAFRLSGREAIHDMWRMICSKKITARFNIVEANDTSGRVSVVDEYVFKADDEQEHGNPVTNVIDSQFKFKDGQIIEQHDFCDERAWARMAIGGFKGFIAGNFGFVRRRLAKRRLEEFVRKSAVA